MVFEILILAMIAAFLGMRLYSVLGRRAEHEDELVSKRMEGKKELGKKPELSIVPTLDSAPKGKIGPDLPPHIERGLRDIQGADRGFQLLPFLDGAKGAYEMVLEAFWNGDRDLLKQLCDDDVFEGFSGAIDEREAAEQTLDNTLIRIEETVVHSAELDGKFARIAVCFNSDIASVTRDKDENVIAGSLDDAIESRDIWTFSRDVTSNEPDWLLDETDIG